MSDGRLMLAVTLNVLLTFAQTIGGILSGSLALIADALHNFSDLRHIGLVTLERVEVLHGSLPSAERPE